MVEHPSSDAANLVSVGSSVDMWWQQNTMHQEPIPD